MGFIIKAGAPDRSRPRAPPGRRRAGLHAGLKRSTRSVMMPSVPSVDQPLRRPFVVDGVAQARRPGAVRLRHGGGVPQRVVADHGDAAERRAVSSQPVHSVSSSRPRGSSGCGGARACRARAGTRSAAAARPRRATAARRARATTSPVRRSTPGVGLISMLSAVAVGAGRSATMLSRRGQRLAGVGARVPAAGVELRQLAPGMVAGDALAGPVPAVGVAPASRRAAGTARRRRYSLASHSNMR